MSLEREPLKGKVFVFTGDMKMSRDDAKARVMVLGGRCTTAPSSKTSFLVVGDNPGPMKIQKANELNIKILNEEEFVKLVESNIDDFSSTPETEKHLKMDPEKGGGSALSSVWNEKYRPKRKDEIIGNPGIMKQLEDYLQGCTKYKAALLSGHPGIGKTTMAHIVCRSLGFDVVEFNASDIRNKSEISSKVRSFTNSQSICSGTSKKKALIMDEVDGMSSDRGGIPELVSVIKKTTIPIICICNDRNNLKIRTLSNHCLDLRFRKPDSRPVLLRIKHILEKEGKRIPDGVLSEIIAKSNGDIRYAISMVQGISLRRTLNSSISTNFVKKSVMKSLFDVAGEVFQRKSVSEKIDLYFEDYSLVPLFVSENVLKTSFKSLGDLSECFDSISLGDVVERLIRGAGQDWSLAPLHAVYSVVIPTRGRPLTKKMMFPSWLGQNSKHLKAERALHTASVHSSCRIRANAEELRKYALELILRRYSCHLKACSIDKAIDNIIEYDMTKEDIDSLGNIVLGGVEMFEGIERKTKIHLDKEYKKLKRKLPYPEVEKEGHHTESQSSEEEIASYQEY
ncbi:DNA replication factor C subunit [Encephalitozoon intestinalis ATCC 50506]|uniref:Replication factor C subunit 1 n=1 Tax=Encephalitozoon intestinalis (strain ATCC 50506) TaxID=876142 RepID=E0S720_ENCIT|nr:DNA replication factor C subunit [Encephalitozoon intestinalis ATCC 50506]ADM11606.1 DNA replication factor C subunit [Encephalitozoon intestinalis ATCC 50506]UTX45325.1 DNA replication factor C subunit [Encephalitozoon intestinalis]